VTITIQELRKRYVILRRILGSGGDPAWSVLRVKLLGLAVRPLDFVLAVVARLNPAPSAGSIEAVVVVGLHRSGSTLIGQAVADALPVAPLDNLTAMFPRSGWLGARLAAFIRRRLRPAHARRAFENFYGVGYGLTGLSDCNEAWDRWVGNDRNGYPRPFDDRTAAAVAAYFTGIQATTSRPLLIKSNRILFYLGWFAARFPRTLFVVVTRDPVAVVKSVLNANAEVLGDPKRLWGLRPSADFDPAAYTDVVEAACAQTVGLESRLRTELAQLPAESWVEVSYERFCADPNAEMKRVTESFAARFERACATRPVASGFRASSRPADDADTRRIRDLIDRFRRDGGMQASA
jgi:hypothetical protein